MTITPLPPAPSNSDNPLSFSQKASAFVAALDNFVTEFNAAMQSVPQILPIACSDETTLLTVGTGKVTFRAPSAMTIVGVRGSLTEAATGSVFIVDVNRNGVSILSTKLSIDAGEKSSFTAAVAAVISDASISDDDEITIDIDQVGSTLAGKGLKVCLLWRLA